MVNDHELWWRRLDVEPRLRAVSLDDDGVVAGVSVVDVSHRETVAAFRDSDVVLGSVLEVEPVLEPLRTRVRLGLIFSMLIENFLTYLTGIVN